MPGNSKPVGERSGLGIAKQLWVGIQAWGKLYALIKQEADVHIRFLIYLYLLVSSVRTVANRILKAL